MYLWLCASVVCLYTSNIVPTCMVSKCSIFSVLLGIFGNSCFFSCSLFLTLCSSLCNWSCLAYSLSRLSLSFSLSPAGSSLRGASSNFCRPELRNSARRFTRPHTSQVIHSTEHPVPAWGRRENLADPLTSPRFVCFCGEIIAPSSRNERAELNRREKRSPALFGTVL